MLKSPRIISVLLITSWTIAAQNPVEYWDTYLASYEKGKPGSITLRMDLINMAPIKKLPFVVVTGITYTTSRDDGFPENETFSILYKIEDELIDLINNTTESYFVGSFTYKKERLEYFYTNDIQGLKEKIKEFYISNYPDFKYYLNIKEDKNWDYYKKFLYPNQETLNYMSDQKVVKSLQDAGDPLTKDRRVDYWIYFPTKSDMDNCAIALKKKGFSIQSKENNPELKLPFELQIWNINKVDLDSIYKITHELREIVKPFNGEYDGWETFVIKE